MKNQDSGPGLPFWDKGPIPYARSMLVGYHDKMLYKWGPTVFYRGKDIMIFRTNMQSSKTDGKIDLKLGKEKFIS